MKKLYFIALLGLCSCGDPNCQETPPLKRLVFPVVSSSYIVLHQNNPYETETRRVEVK